MVVLVDCCNSLLAGVQDIYWSSSVPQRDYFAAAGSMTALTVAQRRAALAYGTIPDTGHALAKTICVLL